MDHYKNLSLEDIEGEEWKAIPGYEGIYSASSLGRIKSLSRIIIDKNGKRYIKKAQIRAQIPDNGYLKIHLRSNDEYQYWWCHRIFCTTFHDNPLNLPFVNHKKGITTDNRATEIEWISYRDNNIHARDVLGHDFSSGIRHRSSDHVQSKKVKQINAATGELIKIWDCVNDAQRAKIASSVSMCATGKISTSGGFKWEYIL